MATRKPKPDPLHARPDGIRLRSAWLTKTFAAAEAAAAAVREPPPDPNTYDDFILLQLNPQGTAFLPGNTVEANAAFLEQMSGLGSTGWACLVDWHGDAALPWLEKRLDARLKSNQNTIRLIACLASPAAQDALLRHLDLPEMRTAVAESAARWPLDTLRRLLALDPRRGQPAAELVQRLLFQHPDWLAALEAQLDNEGDDADAVAQRKTLARLLAPTEEAIDATPAELPPLLREPPWRAGAVRATLPVLAIAPRELPGHIDWSRYGKEVDPRPLDHQLSGRELVYVDVETAALRTLLRALERPDSEIDAMFDGAESWRYHSLITPDEPAAFARLLTLLEEMGKLTAQQVADLRAEVGTRPSVLLHPASNFGRLHLGRRYFFRVEELLADFAAKRKRDGQPPLPTLTEDDHASRALLLLGVRPERLAAVRAAGRCTADDLQALPGIYQGWALYNHLSHLDDALALDVLRWQSNLPHDNNAYGPAIVARLLKRFGAEHLPLLLTPLLLAPASESAWPLYDCIDWDGLAWLLSQRGYAQRRLRPYARRWLLAHPRTAARALIPSAFRADAKDHAHARYHLDLLVQAGHAELLREEARAWSGEWADKVPAAIDTLLATPPETLLPVSLPTLPDWLNMLRLPRLRLVGSDHAVPLSHMADALMPLMLSQGGHDYAGLTQLREAVTANSLARVLLDLFAQWLEHGMPPKARWIFELQGPLGQDANARALAPRIRDWRAGLDRVRAYEGLEALTQIGSDTALMLLSGFTEQKRYSDLQARAAAALERIADERGLSLDELADRTVPTLGLDARGEMALDFGPRSFTARLNGELLPQVFDAQGSRLKELPKPNSKDDPTLGKDATTRWRELKKQAKLVASAQILRLENAMCAQRRWPVADFLAFFAQHPVLRHLSQRCVWAVFDADGHWQHGFRVAEDLTLTDVRDEPFAPPADARIGLPHPLEIPADALAAWGQMLADYAILQAFAQLGREVFTLPPEQAARDDLPHYAGRRVGPGSLLGLENRGWKRGVGDGGIIDHFSKPLPGDWHVTLTLDDSDWFVAGPPPSEGSYPLHGIHLSGSVTPADGPSRPAQWRDLSAVMLSEVLRDVERMAWHER